MSLRGNRLSTSELEGLRKAGEPQIQLVDVRPVDAYNGWRLRGEVRGGHIPGARSVPLKWFSYLDWIEIVRAKDLRSDLPVVIYGYDEDASRTACETFRRAGYDRVRIYPAFSEEWIPDRNMPLDGLARYEHLVPAEWVHRLVTSRRAPEWSDSRFVVCHAHYRNHADYLSGHIPEAVSLDTNRLESPDTWNRRSPDEIREALLSMGITSDTTVVLYGRFSFPENRDPFPGSSAGQLAAFRCAFIMLWAGVEDVRVLNGGMQSWMDAGFEVSTEEAETHPADDFGAVIPGCPELAVDLVEARRILTSEDANLVSVRSRAEYVGEVSGYHYIEKKGRIPGSVFGNCGSDAYHMENYRNLDHTTREYGEIVAEWGSVGVTPDKHNAFYCGTGWRGSEAFYNAWLMGWPRVSVYDGGWFEWSRDDANPIATGPEDLGS